MDWIAYGPGAALMRFGDGPEGRRTRGLARAIAAALEGGHDLVAEWVLAFDQVLIEFRGGVDLEAAAGEIVAWLDSLQPLPEVAVRLHRIPVCYDGEDLAEVAERVGLAVADVVARHSAVTYDVAMLGFAPGFPYLAGMDRALVVPRRATPRTRILAGSVAIGGHHTGIYPVESPGGWHVIGRTAVQFFRPEAGDGESCFFVRAGDRVKFEVEGVG